MQAREGQEKREQGADSRVELAGIAKALAATFVTDSKPNQELTPYPLQTTVPPADHPSQTWPPTSAAAYTCIPLSPNQEKSFLVASSCIQLLQATFQAWAWVRAQGSQGTSNIRG